MKNIKLTKTIQTNGKTRLTITNEKWHRTCWFLFSGKAWTEDGNAEQMLECVKDDSREKGLSSREAESLEWLGIDF